MNFQIRNVGKLPGIIGCKKNGCDGRSIELATETNPNAEIDGVFFRPETNEEWNAIKHQLKFEARSKMKGQSIKKMKDLIDEAMKNFKKHVKQGGLVFLPISYFSEINKD